MVGPLCWSDGCTLQKPLNSSDPVWKTDSCGSTMRPFLNYFVHLFQIFAACSTYRSTTHRTRSAKNSCCFGWSICVRPLSVYTRLLPRAVASAASHKSARPLQSARPSKAYELSEQQRAGEVLAIYTCWWLWLVDEIRCLSPTARANGAAVFTAQRLC